MSPAALKAVFSPDSDDDLIVLATVYDTDGVTPLWEVSDGWTTRISETPTEIIYGVSHQGRSFTFLPLEITLPSEDEAQAPKCQIVIHDVTRYLTTALRSLSEPPKIKLDLVLSKTPDVVEVSFTEFYVSNIVYNADSVTFDLSMIDYEREPFPMHAFTPKYFPGMF